MSVQWKVIQSWYLLIFGQSRDEEYKSVAEKCSAEEFRVSCNCLYYHSQCFRNLLFTNSTMSLTLPLWFAVFLPQNSQCFLEGNPLQPRKILLPVIWPEDGSTSISFAFSFLLLLPNARIYSLTSAPRLYLIFNLVILRFDNCSTLLNAMPCV